jgi:nucleoside-diphosphate-sugar epimerase
MCHIWTRILSVYGPYDGEKTMVMSALHKMLAGERTSFTKGEQKWDYLYSKDAAGMMIALAQNGKDGHTYCLGGGHAVPLSSYIQKIGAECGYQGDLGLGDVPYAEKQVMYLCADTASLLADTQYQYQYTFEEGIKETVEWFRKEQEKKSVF